MGELSSLKRDRTRQTLKQQTADVLVIGGGITGAGIALDARSRGMQTALVDMQDFAAGTSSRSTKLIHGGLRYLKQLQVKMVADVGRERAIVYENGPHVTTPEKMLLPFYRGGNFGPFSTGLGLLVYDLLAGVNKKERRVMLTAEQTIAREPLVKRKNLLGAGLYVEYRTDDARLTIEILKKAVQLGAVAVNYTKVTKFIYEQGKIAGVIVKDRVSGEVYRINAKKIINAAGPWVDELRELDQSKQGPTLHITKGVHLVFSQKVFPLKQAIYFDSPDGRMIFAIPRGDKTYVGTTDTAYTGSYTDPQVTEADRAYLLQVIQYMFPSLALNESHIESGWAGLRPLIADEKAGSPSEISRKDEIFLSSSGLISIAGGKLTGYRKMAEDVIDIVANDLKEEMGVLFSGSNTKSLPISGGDVNGSAGFALFKEQKIKEGMKYGISEQQAVLIAEMYGSNADILFRLYDDGKEEGKRLEIDPLLLAQLHYSIKYEAAYTPADFFARRTDALYFNIGSVRRWKGKVTDYMERILGWSKQQKREFGQELDQLLLAANKLK